MCLSVLTLTRNDEVSGKINQHGALHLSMDLACLQHRGAHMWYNVWLSCYALPRDTGGDCALSVFLELWAWSRWRARNFIYFVSQRVKSGLNERSSLSRERCARLLCRVLEFSGSRNHASCNSSNGSLKGFYRLRLTITIQCRQHKHYMTLT